MNDYLDKSVDRIQTTIGNLVEIITEIAKEFGSNEQESYQLASLTIERILNRSRNRKSIVIQ